MLEFWVSILESCCHWSEKGKSEGWTFCRDRLGGAGRGASVSSLEQVKISGKLKHKTIELRKEMKYEDLGLFTEGELKMHKEENVEGKNWGWRKNNRKHT